MPVQVFDTVYLCNKAVIYKVLLKIFM